MSVLGDFYQKFRNSRIFQEEDPRTLPPGEAAQKLFEAETQPSRGERFDTFMDKSLSSLKEPVSEEDMIDLVRGFNPAGVFRFLSPAQRMGISRIGERINKNAAALAKRTSNIEKVTRARLAERARFMTKKGTPGAVDPVTKLLTTPTKTPVGVRGVSGPETRTFIQAPEGLSLFEQEAMDIIQKKGLLDVPFRTEEGVEIPFDPTQEASDTAISSFERLADAVRRSPVEKPLDPDTLEILDTGELPAVDPLNPEEIVQSGEIDPARLRPPSFSERYPADFDPGTRPKTEFGDITTEEIEDPFYKMKLVRLIVAADLLNKCLVVRISWHRFLLQCVLDRK